MNEKTPKIYLYKLVSDEGGAPCVTEKLLSLAICKPRTRGSAQPDNIIFGFYGKTRNIDQPLIYVAIVTQRVENGLYYKNSEYFEREDCIYQYDKDRYGMRRGARHHKKRSRIDNDLGSPQWKNGIEVRKKANVLLSTDFRYFGDNAIVLSDSRFQKLQSYVNGIKRGERVNSIPNDVRDECILLQKELWRKYRRMKVGNPMDKEFKKCGCGSNKDVEAKANCD